MKPAGIQAFRALPSLLEGRSGSGGPSVALATAKSAMFRRLTMLVTALGLGLLSSSPASTANIPAPAPAPAAAAAEATLPGTAAAGRDRTATRHWAFQPVTVPPVPSVRNARWARTDIDRFVLARLEAEGRTPAPAANRRAWLRRATFDLTGLPPTPDEMDAFLADPGADAFETVTERLLASPHYGERWGRHWLDLARYADTAGDTADYPLPEAWRYRNYVIDAFNADLPYDEFLREQIAGDILARQGPRERYAARVAATGFLALSRRFGYDSENYQHLTLQDTIDTVGQGVLGLSLGCARCHDHKTDPVTMSDYYGLYGIFESTRFAFPGSEQKQKYRALAPLAPPAESTPHWRAFEDQFTALGVRPAGILRSLDDLDGDFELQRFASGGSKGVLVAPWRWNGPVEVTTTAQSPFQHRHAGGSVGVRVRPGSEPWLVSQRLTRASTPGRQWFGLDFRIPTNPPSAHSPTSTHRLQLRPSSFFTSLPSSTADGPGIELGLGADALELRTLPRDGSRPSVPHRLSLPQPGAWHHVQLVIDPDSRTVAGSIGIPGATTPIPPQPLPDGWLGGVGEIQLASATNAPHPTLDFDNVVLQSEPLPAASLEPAPGAGRTPAGANPSDAPRLAAELESARRELEALTGIDGDFELQTDGAAPSSPWHPGPNSAVHLTPAAQSPFPGGEASGRLGLRLPGGDAYQGFGQTLAGPWLASTTDRITASFEFRCGTNAPEAAGSWRHHIGHSHVRAAVELGLHPRALHRRDRDRRDEVCALEPGQWYRVQLELDLRAQRYTGTISHLGAGPGPKGSPSSPPPLASFDGRFAADWDGRIDYTFIDSGGHLPGPRPTLDVDNFTLTASAQSTAATATTAAKVVPAGRGRVEQARALRRQIAELTAGAESERRKLQSRLDAGPMDLAYAVAEGTPGDARIQLRGDPDQPGSVVPRGFIRALGGTALPAGTEGSGRLELARWLTRPDHPLTARVLVNRVWQHHFGRGIVPTPNDFGLRGQPPEDPALLDHLASAFVRDGWSIKALHRRILASAVYRQASIHPGPSTPPDAPANGFPAVFPRRRLAAEEIRDAILAVSGALDRTPGQAHPFPPPTSWGYTQHAPFSAVYDHDKRSVYLMTQRLKRHPFLALFDGPDPNASTAERRTTTVPTQALYFLNDPFVHAKSARFASRLLAAPGGDRNRVDLAHRLALGRPATAAELDQAAAFLAAYREELAPATPTPTPAPVTAPASTGDQHRHPAAETEAWAAYARVLFGSNEFLNVD